MILLAHSNFIVRDPKQQAKMKPYSPLSTLITAALLRRKGTRSLSSTPRLKRLSKPSSRKLEAVDPDVVFLLEDNFNFLTKMCTIERRESALAMIALPPVAAAGRRQRADAADNPAIYLCAGADAIVLGEGEMGNAGSRGSLEWFGGRAFRHPRADSSRNRAAQVTRPRHPQQDLDGLPHPAWDLIDVDAYRRAWMRAHQEFSWNMATSRGCPYACNWCAKPTFGRRYSVRSPEDVAREMQRIRQDIAPTIVVHRRHLRPRRRWICAFADEVERAGAQIPFTMQSRVNLMTERSVEAMARAGAREVWLGIEFGFAKNPRRDG